MEIVIHKKWLVSLLSKAVNVLPSRPALPVLTHIMIEVADNEMTVCGTDLEVTVKLKQKFEGSAKNGKVVVPGKNLLEIARRFPETEIKLSSEKENKLQVSHEKIIFTLMGTKTDDFPVTPKSKETQQPFKISVATLKKMVGYTRSVAAPDENKPAISGVFFTTESGWLTAVATDTRRLVRYKTKSNLNREVKFILPLKTADILRGLWEEEGEVDVYPGENNCLFSGNQVTLTTQLIAGAFPDYTRVIPEEKDLTPLSLPTNLFQQALERINQIVAGGKNVIRIDLEPNLLKISGETAGVGAGMEELPVSYQQKPGTFYFNPDYLLDGVKKLEGEETFLFCFNPNPEKPNLLRKTTGDEYLYLVMPMRP